jgi:hypothetical protein
VRHHVGYRLLIIAVCSLMALSHVCAEMNSTLCFFKKFAPSESHVCCVGAGIQAWPGIQENSGSSDIREDASEPFSANCCQEGCCKVCNSPPFLTSSHALMFIIPTSCALAEMNIPLPLPDFSSPVFKPPQA